MYLSPGVNEVIKLNFNYSDVNEVTLTCHNLFIFISLVTEEYWNEVEEQDNQGNEGKPKVE